MRMRQLNKGSGQDLTVLSDISNPLHGCYIDWNNTIENLNTSTLLLGIRNRKILRKNATFVETLDKLLIDGKMCPP